jgi:hypothetical protein
MIKILEARVLDSFRLYVRFSDGAAGEVDLSALAGQGVFTAWNDPAFFERVQIGSSGRNLEWDEQIDLSADSLYLNLTGKTVQELFPMPVSKEMRA